MNNKKVPLGVKIAKAVADSNSIKEDNVTKESTLIEYKQLLLNMNELLDNKNFIDTLENDKEINSWLKEIIIKSVTILH